TTPAEIMATRSRRSRSNAIRVGDLPTVGLAALVSAALAGPSVAGGDTCTVSVSSTLGSTRYLLVAAWSRRRPPLVMEVRAVTRRVCALWPRHPRGVVAPTPRGGGPTAMRASRGQ